MEKKRPAHEIKLGLIRATIWANETEDRDVWFNVSVSRLYETNAKWKESTTFRRDDLPIAVKAMQMAYGWIWRKQVQLNRVPKESSNQASASVGK